MNQSVLALENSVVPFRCKAMFARLILPLIAASAVVFCQPAVTNVRVDDTKSNGGHSSLRVTWDTDSAPDNQRIQWGSTTALGKVYYVYSPSYAASNQQVILSG